MSRLALAFAALCLALAAVAACGYRFAVEDQAQYLVEMLITQDPGLFAGDLYIKSFGVLWSGFWIALAGVLDERGLSRGVLAIHLGITLANALILAWIMARLTGEGLPKIASARIETAEEATAVPGPPERAMTGRIAVILLPAALLVVPKELNWFGLVSLSDRELTATSAVVPLILLGMGLWIRGRPWLALVPLLISIPIQGQSAAFALATWWAATAWDRRGSGRGRMILGAIAAAGVAGLYTLRLRHAPEPGSWGQLREIGLGLYPALVNPLLAPISAWLGVLSLLGIGVLSAWRLGLHSRWRSGSRDAEARCGDRSGPLDRLGVWAIASLAYPGLGLALHAIGIEDALLWRLMVGRSLMLAQIASILLFAAWIASVRGRRAVVLAAVAGAVVTLWPVGGGRPIFSMIAMGVVMLAIVFDRRRAIGDPARIGSFPARARARLWAPVPASTALLAALAAGLIAWIERPYPWLRSAEEPAWLEAQRWAREHTPPEAVFITPPHRSGWRIGSRRASAGEIKDGCLLFYAGEPALRWRERMDRLGMEGVWSFLEVYGVAGGGDRVGPGELSRRYHRAIAGPDAGRLSPLGEYLVIETGSHGAGATGSGPQRGTRSPPGRAVWANGEFEIRVLEAD